MSIPSQLRRERTALRTGWSLWEALHDAAEAIRGTCFALALVDVDVTQLPLLTVLGRLMDGIADAIEAREV